MKTAICFLLFLSNAVYAYQDDELAKLWSSIVDVTHPSLEEYKNIEKYLKDGERNYLAPIAHHNRMPLIRRFQLVGPNNEMPIFETHHCKIKEKTKQRCVLIFGSYNGIYPNKARRLLSDLNKCGYSGDVLIRIGGFPNLPNHGLKLCHVPYAFKVAFLKEAQLLGYKEVLWLDTAMHPLTNLEEVFSSIKEKGYFFTEVGVLSSNHNTHLPGAAASLNIPLSLYDQIPHISSSMIGLNMENPLSVQLMEDWLKEAENVSSFMTCWPEELSLSVIAWRLNYKAYSEYGNCVCGEDELQQLSLILHRPLLFYIDTLR